MGSITPNYFFWRHNLVFREASCFSPEDNKGFAARIEDEIRSANFLLTIQTPNSRMRPWLVWEAALAVGAKIPTFVVLYSIKPGQTGNPLDGMHQYSQDRDNNGDKDGWVSAIKDIEKIIGLIAKTNGVKSDPGVVGVAMRLT